MISLGPQSTAQAQRRHDGDLIKTILLSSATLTPAAMAPACDHPAGTALVIGFVSPHCDFQTTATTISAALPKGVPLLLVSSAGELCGTEKISPYCETGDHWDTIVLAGFSRALFAEVAIHSVPLPNEDIRQGYASIPNEQRMARLAADLERIKLPFPCDYRDTFVLTFVDGVSLSESLLLEAVYRTGMFPLYFVGGSAGGTFDFAHTYLYDGTRVIENHAILCFIKMAPNMRYSIFKSQNFRNTGTAFVIADADPNLRVVRTVTSPATFEPIPFVSAVSAALGCDTGELESRLKGKTFGVEVGGELYIRSMKDALLNIDDGSASFYCDVDFGDCLYLLEPTDFVATTRNDFNRFLDGKPTPVGGIINDCVLRRVNNGPQLEKVDAFQGFPLAGFSTFGEIFGLNINQTVSAIFFFPGDTPYADDLIDRFPIHYASFCSFFDRRIANRLQTLETLRQRQERTQRQLQREHEFSQALIGSLPGIFILLDAEGNLVRWNENIETATGRDLHDLMGTPMQTLYAREDRPRVMECIARAFNTGRAATEAHLIGKDGSLIPYYISALAITLDGERYLTGVGIDISDRKQIEAAFHASRKRLKMITDNLAEGVLVVDQSGSIAFANPSATRLLECSTNWDLEGHPITDIFRLDPDSTPDDAKTPWVGAMRERLSTKDDDAVVITLADRKLPIAYVCTPLFETDAKPAAIISFRDINDLKKVQREMIQSSRLASVGQLAAGIAHEINTPIQYIGSNLNFIAGSLETLMGALPGHEPAEGPPPKSKLDFLAEEMPVAIAESLDGVAQISRIVLSMKEFSHPGSTSKTMSDINRALESTLTVSRNVWRHVATTETDLAPDLPKVLCHAGELNQVFLNLIVNASHAIESSGKPLPGLLRVTTSHRNGIVEVRVSDNGSGIPDTIREKIFDPFFTTKEVGKGTGQGLAICRDVIVTKHGGTLDFETEFGTGTTFVIRLPVDGGGDEKDHPES